jgi:hypothetical protein
LICGYCNQRYGLVGVDYNSVMIGICPVCKKIEEKHG